MTQEQYDSFTLFSVTAAVWPPWRNPAGELSATPGLLISGDGIWCGQHPRSCQPSCGRPHPHHPGTTPSAAAPKSKHLAQSLRAQGRDRRDISEADVPHA